MTKVLMIGIDGLDSGLLSKFENDLPNFRKLKEESPGVKLQSVYPPDSPTAWTSIYTGLNPAKHGVVFFKDPLAPAAIGAYTRVSLQGKTFWDIASLAGKRVCILFPHMGYPPWSVNGVMLGRTTDSDIREFAIQILPQSLSRKYKLSHLKPLTSYPVRIGSFVEHTKRLVSNEIEFGLRILKDFDWDLFFIYFSSLDNIEHNFWMYCDEKDPQYIDNNPFKNIVKDFYMFYDEVVIGKLLSAVDANTTVIVLSDHGHGMRPVKVVNMNEILRNQGFLASRIKEKSSRDTYYLRDKLKRGVAGLIDEHRLVGKAASKFLRLFPKSLGVYTSTSPIDWQKTSAYLSDPSAGIKTYSYAGIKIKRENMGDVDYEEMRSRLVKIVSEIKEPNSGEKLTEWVCRREELYSGEYICKYPDIVFKLKDDYGAGWAINDSVIGSTRSHKIQSGNHRMDSAVFLISGVNNAEYISNNATLMDIAPTVLDLLGIKGDFGFDGQSVLEL